MDIVLNPIVSSLVDKLVGLASEELRSILGVPEEIQKLRDMLRSIQAVLNDAERRQIAEQGVKRWLSNLRDVMYDADDILDEYQITAKEPTAEDPSLGCAKWRKIPYLLLRPRHVEFQRRIAKEIRSLNKRLEKIWADKSNFDIRVSDRQREVVIRVGRQTSSGVEPDIVGEAIEKDTIDLIQKLTSEYEDANDKVVVLAVVGIGGIGKTTLAQKIFNDDKIKNAFKMIWVCVSQESVETDILKEIILGAGGTLGEARSKALLEEKVVNLLKDVKFFLVLDDVWDAKIWDNWLRKPLQVGAVGSRVLITTRNKGVADRMKANHIHYMDALSLDDSWLLLRKKVTKNAVEKRDVESLKDVGMRIVEKCQGLPLAIIAIGGVLCGKLNKWEWERVECNSVWSQEGLPEGVHQALYLSYQDLPSNLKQCFLHCSLFREDSQLKREDLVQLWVAEGFVVKIEGEEYLSPEEIAQGYFDELIQRSLLQGWRKFTYCTIHDLLRSLCHFLARGENLVICDISKGLPSTTNDDSIKLRRLSIVDPELEDIKPFLHSHLTQRHNSVRTLLLKNISMDDEGVDKCLRNFPRLRVVHLGSTSIQSLPESVGNLLHLRYLNISYCSELRSLPERMANLLNLKFLFLQGCNNLHTIPRGVVQLRNLRTLIVGEEPLKELPSGIARLEHLNVLKGAAVSSFSNHSSNNSSGSNSSSSSCSLEEICQLRKLRELSIVLKTSAISNPDVNGLNRSLTDMNCLLDLELSCTNDRFDGHDINDSIFDVALHPPSCVLQIKICKFFGRQFPRWLMSNNISSLLPNLKKLVLCECGSCSQLPPLGKLPNLEWLELDDLDAVSNIGAEFFGYEEASTSDELASESGGSNSASSSQVLFPRLTILILRRLSNLETWDWVPEVGGTVAMSELEDLIVEGCPKLLSLPEGLSRQAISLTCLLIKGMNINFISGIPSLKRLWIQLNKEENLSLLDRLVRCLQYFTSLQTLRLICEDTQPLYMCLQDGQYWSIISHFPEVEIKDHKGNYITYNKHSSIYQTNII